MATTQQQSALSVFGKGSTTTTKKLYPKLPDQDGTIAKMVDARKAKKVEADILLGEIKQTDGALKELTFDEWLRKNEDRDVTDDTFECVGKGSTMKVSVKSQYWDLTHDDNEPKHVIREQEIKKLLGVSFGNHVQKKFILSVDGSEIPPQAKDNFLAGLAQLLQEHGADPALAVKAKEVLSIRNNGAFHVERHSILNNEENRQLHGLWSCAVSAR